MACGMQFLFVRGQFSYILASNKQMVGQPEGLSDISSVDSLTSSETKKGLAGPHRPMNGNYSY